MHLTYSSMLHWISKDGMTAFEYVVAVIICAIASIFLNAFVVMLMWNVTLPQMFLAFPCLSFLDALALTLLVMFLFGI